MAYLVFKELKESVESGVNFRSVLMNLEYFDLTSGCLVTDIMHDVLEGKHLLLIGSHIQMKTCIGMAMKETVLMLRQMIYEEEYVTLDDLNSCLSWDTWKKPTDALKFQLKTFSLEHLNSPYPKVVSLCIWIHLLLYNM